MKDVIVILTDINARCDTAHLFTSNNSPRAKTRRRGDVELTDPAVTPLVMKGARISRTTGKEDGINQ